MPNDAKHALMEGTPEANLNQHVFYHILSTEYYTPPTVSTQTIHPQIHADLRRLVDLVKFYSNKIEKITRLNNI